MVLTPTTASADTYDGTQLGQQIVLTRDANGTPTSGMITFDVDTEFPMQPLATENVGGGTWTYGTHFTSEGKKVCRSTYLHQTKTHTATAIMDEVVDRKTARPGTPAAAEVVGGIFSGTCNAYWSTQ